MADTPIPPNGPEGQTIQGQTGEPGQVMVQVDESRAHMAYVNAWQLNAGTDEIVCDLGVQIPRMMGNQQTISFQVGTRVVLSPNSAMRFAAALQQVIAQREQRMAQSQQQGQTGG
ncbi:MAG: DUF3467 domain-containing protein [Planctomycetes bacterium]|nr:DUF3467 domain-containing protein [Planctomycetota bacterium]